MQSREQLRPHTFLGIHSESSLLGGVGSVARWVAQAKALGYTSLGLTDVNRMSGLVLFTQECERQGIKPLLGVELREAADPDLAAFVFARNDQGYGDLCELITWRQTGLPRRIPFSLGAAFAEDWPNVIVLSSSVRVLEALGKGPNRARAYGALVCHSAQARAHSRVVEAWCDRAGVPVAACGDAWFVTPQEHAIHRVLRAIDLNSTLSRLRPGETAPEGAWLRPPSLTPLTPSTVGRESMEELFENRPDAIESATHIAAACTARPPMNGWVMPRIDVPEGYTPESFLAQEAREGLRKHYAGTPAFARAAEIQEMELGVINKLGFASYFLMVQDVFRAAGQLFAAPYRKPMDCSLLRGSAANSLTFYNLGVGRLDPIEHDLYFQRFLNEDRASPPDADLDFGWDERERILEHVVKRYGRARVAITCTFQHFRFKAAFRETAKVFGYAEDQVTEVLEARESRQRRRDDESLRNISAWARRIQGRPRFLGQHPGGLIITNEPIWRHVGCEWSRSVPHDVRADGAEGADGVDGSRLHAARLITQIDMHSGIDELGLIKFDLLGNGSLSVLRDALDQIRAQGRPDPQVWDLRKCYADPKANALMRSGNLRGVFYLESPAQTRLNKKANVETFDEVIVTSSLIRPAGTAYAKTYVERHRKSKMNPPVQDWEFLHPSLIPILGATHDVCAFQEDVTKICHEVAGLSYKRADAVRKQMNSQHDGALSTPALRALAEEFITGCMTNPKLAHPLTRAQGEELWQRVASFTGFSFCKSHSASYAQLSYQCVWLKAHHPAEFLSAVLTNNHGFYRREVYLNEARRLGLELLPLDINASVYGYIGAGAVIRPGFVHLKHVSRITVDALQRERESTRGRFCDLEDFLKRVPAGRKETEHFILAGAFDGFGMTQPELLYHLDGIYNKVSARAGGPASLFETAGSAGETRTLHRIPTDLRDITLMERCLNEKRLFGYMLSGNPLAVLDVHPAARDAVPVADIGRHVGQRVKVFGLQVTERLHMVQKSGRLMKFLTLEDQSGTVDVIFWPDMLDRWEEQLYESGPFEIWGRVTEEWDTYSLEAEQVRPVVYTPNLVDFERASLRLKTGRPGVAADTVHTLPAAGEIRIHAA
jgi:error-prone DNA polymerase